MSHPAMDQTGNTFRNMDFNKLFKEGISYLRPDDEAKMRNSICFTRKWMS